MAKRTCKVCSEPHNAKGYCVSHYNRWRRYGDPFYQNPDCRHLTVDERFEIDVDRSAGPNGCWPWTGYVMPSGYAMIRQGKDGYREYAHREAYIRAYGPLENDETVDHACHSHDRCTLTGADCPHRRCCNPRHLEAVPQVENAMRGNSPLAQKARQTHCHRGHPLSGDNLYLEHGHRHCRACVSLREREKASA